MAPFRTTNVRPPRPPLPAASGREGGFALIVSLSLMAVVMLAVVLLAGQVRLGIAGSSSETDRIRVQESARLAFAMALGELQRTAGPDRRVTARAEIAFSDEELVESRRFQTGVWDSGNESEVPVGWLVSGGVDPTSPVGDDDVFVLDEGDVSGLPASDRVHAPFVSISPEQRIAWWVGDEGVKAPLKRVGDESRFPLGADFSNRFVRSINMMGGAFRSGFEVLAREMLPGDGETDFDQLTQGDAARRMMGAEDVLKILPAGSEFEPGQFHSLTTVSAGVLSNTLEGGLRLNLDPFLESPETGETDPFLNGDLIPYLDVDSNYTTFRDPNGIMGSMTGLDSRDNSSVGWDRPGENQMPEAPTDGFRAYHHLSPVLTEAAIYFSVFQRVGNPAIRFYMDVELWNPYPFPLLLSTGDTRALTVLVEGLPEIRITQYDSDDEYVSDSGWVAIDDVPLSSGVRETGSWLQIDTYGEGPWPRNQPAFLMPGETYRLEDPDPRHQPQGLWKNMGNVNPSDVENTDKILVEGRAPGGADVGRMSLKLVRGNSQGSGANRRLADAPPLFEVLNIPYEGDPALFRWGPTRADGQISSRPRRFGTKKYIFGSGTGEAVEVRESYIFALHFGIASEDAADLSTFFENFDFRYPRLDFQGQLETPEGSVPMADFIRTAGADPVNGSPMNPRLVESQIDNVFPLGSTEVFKDGEVREQDPEPSGSVTR
ncbi:MAG: PilW family protein, partial [Puniceicoccaceae bacterium]